MNINIVNQSVKELEDRESRKLNIIIYNAPESQSQLKDNTVKHDKDILKQLTEICTLDLDINTIEVKRLGEHKPATTRPLLVKFVTEDGKKKLYKNISNLKNSNLQALSIQNDLTKSEREELKKLVTDAKELEHQSGGELCTECGDRHGIARSSASSPETHSKH